MAVASGLFAFFVVAASASFCPRDVRIEEVIDLDFGPAFLSMDEGTLYCTSFFNYNGAPDLVARISGKEVEVISGEAAVWPNEALRVPEGVFDFPALIVPQGFFTSFNPGRLTVIDLDTLEEQVISQSTVSRPEGFAGFPILPQNKPRFYHQALFMDMNGDGEKDIVTVRSGFFFVGVTNAYPPLGELVYFSRDDEGGWAEVELVSGFGPDIALKSADFEGDGVPEIVATHFFSGTSQIALYGAAAGAEDWTDVDNIRVATLSDDQGLPFDVELVDLNKDGKLDILASNHQADGCTEQTTTPPPGRVYALEQPKSGDIFNDPWKTHILLDNIFPQPSLLPVPAGSAGRLAPGRAFAFYKNSKDEKKKRKLPWIAVSGDEAGKVWVLKPKKHRKFKYKAAVVFDINDFYGEGTTQTGLAEFPDVTISTIGSMAVDYDRKGFARLYIPVFEGQQIVVLSFRPRRHPKTWFKKHNNKKNKHYTCPKDITLECAA